MDQGNMQTSIEAASALQPPVSKRLLACLIVRGKEEIIMTPTRSQQPREVQIGGMEIVFEVRECWGRGCSCRRGR